MSTLDTEPKFFTITDLCARWKVGRSTIYREIARRRLSRRHIGGQVRFAAADVAKYEQADRPEN